MKKKALTIIIILLIACLTVIVFWDSDGNSSGVVQQKSISDLDENWDSKRTSKRYSATDTKNLMKRLTMATQPASDVESEAMSDQEKKIWQLVCQYNEVIGERLDPMAIGALDQIMDSEKKDDIREKYIEHWGEEYLKNSKFITTKMDVIKCSESLCKVIFSHGSTEERDVFQSIIFLEGPWSSGHQFGGNSILSEDTAGTFLYFSENDSMEPFLRMREIIAEKLGLEVLPRDF